VVHMYADEANATAVVKVTKGTKTVTNSVAFQTIRCGG